VHTFATGLRDSNTLHNEQQDVFENVVSLVEGQFAGGLVINVVYKNILDVSSSYDTCL
jgi:hypothetical protein